MQAKNAQIKILQLTDDDRRSAPTEIRASLYARHSSEGNSPLSCDEQIERIRYRVSSGQIRSKAHPLAKIVIDEKWVLRDEAKTGRTTGREGYELALSGVNTNAFDMLLTDDVSRLTRELGETLDLHDALVFRGIEGVSVSDNISTLDTNARDLFIFKGYANEAQSKATSRHTMRGLEVRCQKGFSTGHNPYGYYSVPTKTLMMKGHEKPSWYEIKIDCEKAANVVRIWREFSDGVGCREIANRLNLEGVKSPGKGKHCAPRWSEKAVWNVLNQSKYLGLWPYRQTRVLKNPNDNRMAQVARPKTEWIVLQREDLKIIPEDVAERVAKRKATQKLEREEATTPEQRIFSRTNKLPSHVFIGTLKCGVCGANMFIASGKKGGYLGCFKNKRETGHERCPNKSMVRMVDVETTLVDMLRERLDDSRTYEVITRKYNEIIAGKKSAVPNELSAVEEEIGRTEAAIKNFTSFIAQGNFSDAISQALRDGESKLAPLRVRRDYLKRQLNDKVYITPGVVKARFESLNEILAKKMSDANRVMRRLFPEKVTMYPPGPGKASYSLAGAINLWSLVRFDIAEVGVP